jgi:acyl carrier protein
MEELLKILTKIRPDIDFETNESLVDDGIWSSTDIGMIATEVYSVFDVTIPPEEIVPENFNSAKLIMALINKIDDE